MQAPGKARRWEEVRNSGQNVTVVLVNSQHISSIGLGPRNPITEARHVLYTLDLSAQEEEARRSLCV